MSPASVPPIVLAGITFYVGVYHLLVYTRRRQGRENLTFALTCLAVCLYDLFSAGLYGVSTPEQGVSWQRAQMVALTSAGIAFTWFVSDYTRRVSKKILWGFSVCYSLVALTVAFERVGLTWSSRPSIKHVSLPFGIELTYYEMAPGLIADLIGLLSIVIFAYAFWAGVRQYRVGRKDKARPLLLALVIFFAGVFNDTAVNSSVYSFVYMIEYAFLALVLCMAYSLSNEIVQAATVQEALGESERRFREMADLLPTIVAESDMNLRVVYVNRIGLKTFGYTQEDFEAGIQTRQLVHPDQHDTLKTRVGEMLEGREPEIVEFRLVRKDGSEFIGLVDGAPIIRDGRVVGFRNTVMDITDRKRSEEALVKSEGRYRDLFDAISDFIYTHDLEGRIMSLNPIAAQSLGYTVDELVGRSMFDLMPRKYRSDFQDDYLPRLQKQGHAEGVLILLDRDGAEHYLEYRSALQRGEDGQAYVSGSGRDVTERISFSIS